jgi:pyridoxal biosynthesis lyase PdxS
MTSLILTLFEVIKAIMSAVSIPVMAKVRIGHFAEAQILEVLGVDFIDESEGIARILSHS